MASEAERVIGLYRRHARSWDEDRGRSLFARPWLDRLLALLPQRAVVLDLGCGSGEPIARYLVEAGCTITGVDTSPDLINLCRGRLPAHEWIVADMRGLSLDRLFNGVLAWDSFFHLRPEEQRGMFAVFRRHAAPRAALMFTSGPSHGEVIGTYRGEPLYHASLSGTEYRSLLNGFGLEVVSHAKARSSRRP